MNSDELLRSVRLAWNALLPSKSGEAVSVGAGVVRECEPEEIRGGMGRFLDATGELQLFFPRCRPFAGPFLMFRLKREGFSRCTVKADGGGLLLRARR